ncbi:MAG: protein kinase [Rubrobacteraceae bacterium]|uniref:protein kinase domain-containing protein n=1 Tax=Rubrobacter naiadicus TaxID=1392641 RepID=UPI0023615384|nr:protein kinase [Rubrobacter naiadicus]MBX6764175.1 serine/threonine protein kinase [Rubrobacteraceae bacterium]MCL6439429.1 protein kinase [Rubrobacteraceae bacterium]
MSGGGKALDDGLESALVGRYRVQSTIGSGGMAVVYRAEDTVLGRLVALKTLREAYAEDATFRVRFRQEARAMASLDHENIVRIYDIYRDGQLPFIVAEYVDGNDVGKLIERRGRLSEQHAKNIAVQVLRALSYAHGRGIIHRDIKPQNVLSTWDGRVKVADFGIARMLEDEGAESGEIVGSARYMSPEQLRGEEATPRSDIYAVGVLLYHCLVGRPPFNGSLKKIMRDQLRKPPRPPRQMNRKISAHTEAVILKALSKDPSDRYASAEEMLRDLLESQPTGGLRGQLLRGRRMLAAASLAVLLVFGGGVSLAASLIQPTSGSDHTAAAASGGSGPQKAGVGGQQKRSVARTPAKEQKTARGRPRVTYVTVPDMRAYFDYAAQRVLEERGFKVRFVYEQHAGFANRGVTWATRPAMGTRAPEGSTVTVYATPKVLPQPTY